MGLPIGEAIVFFDRRLGEEFAYRCKQAGQLASKMRYLSAPWLAMLTDGVWLRHAGHANAMAHRLSEKVRPSRGRNSCCPPRPTGSLSICPRRPSPA